MEWASRESVLRLLEAAELLIREANLDRAYPVEYIVWKLTGWKQEAGDTVASVPGDALVADLVTMIQRLSRRCAMDWPATQPPLLLDEVAKSLRVSKRSLARFRRHGLVMRYVKCADGHLRLACQQDTLAWFRRARASVCGKPRSESIRETRDAIIEAARRIDHGGGLVEMSTRLAAMFPGRSVPAIRGTLRRAVERGALPARPPRRVSQRDGRLAIRAERMGIRPSQLARRLGVGTPALHRLLQRARARQLAVVCAFLPPVPEATDDSAVLEEVLLGSQLPLWTAEAALNDSEAAVPGDVDLDLRGVSTLLQRIHAGVEALASQPPARDVDRVHADVLWLTKLKWRLSLRYQPVVRHSIETWSGRPASALPPEMQRRLLRAGMQRVLEVVALQRPGDRERIESRVRSAVGRMLAELETPRSDLASVRVGETPAIPLRSLERCAGALPSASWERRVATLETPHRELACCRWGLEGFRPRTLVEVASMRGKSRAAMARAWFAAQRALVRA
ncbi:MAG: hypothetical protein QF561_04275 [Phycisphaerales bacterium]|nr:hypothetical protein [Phycisphaerales bacterium]